MRNVRCYDVATQSTLGKGPSALLSQMNYWLSRSKHVHDQHLWVYNTMKEWGIQIGASERTVSRYVKALEVKGILVIDIFNHHKYDRTQWYRIDFHKLVEFCSEKLGRDCHDELQHYEVTAKSNRELILEILTGEDSQLVSWVMKTGSVVKQARLLKNFLRDYPQLKSEVSADVEEMMSTQKITPPSELFKQVRYKILQND